MAFQGTGSSNTDDNLPALELLNAEQTQEYQKWTPFADVWDVRSCLFPMLLSMYLPLVKCAHVRGCIPHVPRAHATIDSSALNQPPMKHMPCTCSDL